MTAPDFRALLAKPLDDVKRPPPPPAGTYYGILGKFKYQASRWVNEETGEADGQVRFAITNVEPGDDVRAQPELLEGADLAKRQFGVDLPISGGNEYVTKTLLEALGISCTGRGWGEVIPEAPGHAVMFEVQHRPNKNDPTAPPFPDVRNVRARPPA